MKTEAIRETENEFNVRLNNISKSILSRFENILEKLKKTGTIKAKKIGTKQIR